LKKYSTVIFDLDGTLLNTIEDLTNALNHTLQEFDMPTRTLPEVQSFVGNGLRLLLIRAIPQGEDNPQFEEVFAAFKTYYTDHCKEATAPYPGIMELLKTLQEHEIPMAIVAADFFEGIISVAIGEKNGVRKKPAPDTVFTALEELGESADSAVYVGDSEVDLQTAANSGMDCISVAWGFKGRAFLEKEGASHIVDTPEEILGFLI